MEMLHKPKTIRDTFLNMLGEFVALNKSPDYKLTSQSNQYLAEVIRDESRNSQKKQSSVIFSQSYPEHQNFMRLNRRTSSTNSGYLRSFKFVNFQSNSYERKNFDLKRNDPCRQSLPVIDNKNLLLQTGFFQRIRNQKTEKKEEKKNSTHKISLDKTQKKLIQSADSFNNNKVRARKQKVTLDDMIGSNVDFYSYRQTSVVREKKHQT